MSRRIIIVFSLLIAATLLASVSLRRAGGQPPRFEAAAFAEPSGPAMRALSSTRTTLPTSAATVMAASEPPRRAVVLAQAPGALPAVATGGGEVSMAERLFVRFQGYPDLSGEYRVRSDGSISIPVIGRVAVAGLTDSEIEYMLARQLLKSTGREAYVTVEVAEYRSFYVTGYVTKPGSFAWRPGMTVLQAVALSGGIFRLQGESGSFTAEDSAVVRLQRAVTEQKRNLAALARLQAEQKDLTTIEVPGRLLALVGREEAEALVDEQRTALTSRNSALASKRAVLAKATDMANRELGALEEQAARLNIQLDSRKSYKETVDSLRSKGIVRTERSIDEAARVFELQDRETQINVATARVQVMLAGLERDKINLETGRKADIDAEIITHERAIALLEIEIDAARTTYRKLTGHDAPMSLSSGSNLNKKLVARYEIVRGRAGGSQTVPAEPFVLLQPGDTLVVSVD